MKKKHHISTRFFIIHKVILDLSFNNKSGFPWLELTNLVQQGNAYNKRQVQLLWLDLNKYLPVEPGSGLVVNEREQSFIIQVLILQLLFSQWKSWTLHLFFKSPLFIKGIVYVYQQLTRQFKKKSGNCSMKLSKSIFKT